jgi:hypothetical protein
MGQLEPKTQAGRRAVPWSIEGASARVSPTAGSPLTPALRPARLAGPSRGSGVVLANARKTAESPRYRTSYIIGWNYAPQLSRRDTLSTGMSAGKLRTRRRGICGQFEMRYDAE